jgi:hypothetical protein
VLTAVSSRRAKPTAGQQVPSLPWYKREKATGTLKAALAQGRLTEEEYDARAAQIPTLRLGADLAELTADLPDGLNARLPKARDAWTGLAVITAAAGLLAAMFLLQLDDYLAFATALFTAAILLLAPPITVGLIIDARHQKRTAGLLRLGPDPSTNS